jgi:hypothetical protein
MASDVEGKAGDLLRMSFLKLIKVGTRGMCGGRIGEGNRSIEVVVYGGSKM